MLTPDEQFTVSVLSGSTPKVPGKVRTLNIYQGPTYSTDMVVVETSDHARLNIMLSYNWYFKINREDPADAKKIFAIRDFVGDMCNLLASKVRAAVASCTFDDFHKSSAKTIRKAIFGLDKEGHVVKEFEFPKNGLVITNVDIQKVEPESLQTRQKLRKSVTLAIKITTDSQEANFSHQQQRQNQENLGRLRKL